MRREQSPTPGFSFQGNPTSAFPAEIDAAPGALGRRGVAEAGPLRRLLPPQLGEAGAGALAAALRTNSGLEELYVANTNIGEAGARALAEVLEEFK